MLRPHARPRLPLARAASRRAPACSRSLALSAAAVATTAAAPLRYERVGVPCRSNGSITVDILHSATPASPILIYLPAGPVMPDYRDEEERVVSVLAAASKATIARVNYRASSEHQYPTPYHDVLFGFDWIRDNLLHHDSSSAHRPYLAKMGVCGELLGGSLATMLALTECHRGESRIGAAAVNNPIVDWVFPDDLPAVPATELPDPPAPDETSFPAEEDLMAWWSQKGKAEASPAAQKSKRAKKPPPPTSWRMHQDNTVIPTLTLSGERDVLFRRPEDYFDRFASPIHFFRSPHGHLLYPTSDDDLASSSPASNIEPLDVEAQMSLNHYQSFDDTPTTPELPTLARCRAYARIYPPAGTNISLPAMHITTGLQSPLSDQASELAKMVQRSIARQMLKRQAGRSRWLDAKEKETYEKYASDKVRYVEHENLGLWTEHTDNPNWNSHVEVIGTWMAKSLEKDS